MTRYIYYKLYLHEPLVIGDGNSTGNIVRSADYIAGSTIHGLFANLYIDKHCISSAADPGSDPRFNQLFFSDRVHFLNAYPYNTSAEFATLPMPLTIMGCKYFGNGDYTSGAREHGLEDTVFRPNDTKIQCPVTECPHPDMKHRDGYLYRYNGQLRRTTVATRIDMHNQVGDNYKDPQVFALEAIERGLSMYGHIAIDEEVFDDLFHVLHDLLWGGTAKHGDGIRIGRAKNRGYGLCGFTWFGKRDTPVFEPMSAPAYVESGGDTFVALYCYSDIALKDHLGRALPTIAAGHIVPDQPHSLVWDRRLSYWQPGSFTGFNNKKRMPSRRIYTIKKGSVFVYRVADQEALSGVEFPDVVGEHRNIGFGRVLFNHHMQNGQGHGPQ